MILPSKSLISSHWVTIFLCGCESRVLSLHVDMESRINTFATSLYKSTGSCWVQQYYMRKRPLLCFLSTSFVFQRKSLQEDMLFMYHLMAKGGSFLCLNYFLYIFLLISTETNAPYKNQVKIVDGVAKKYNGKKNHINSNYLLTRCMLDDRYQVNWFMLSLFLTTIKVIINRHIIWNRCMNQGLVMRNSTNTWFWRMQRILLSFLDIWPPESNSEWCKCVHVERSEIWVKKCIFGGSKNMF